MTVALALRESQKKWWRNCLKTFQQFILVNPNRVILGWGFLLKNKIMLVIYLETQINAPIERVFDLARNIDLHQKSTRQTSEKAIAGKTTGLLELGETVTWRAKHFGIYQNLTVTMIECNQPFSFTDTMVQGAFKSMIHYHSFEALNNETIMKDEFHFSSPLGIIGKLINYLFLEKYMTNFLLTKNSILKGGF